MSASSTRRAWTEADLIAVDDLYREYGQQLDAEHAEVQAQPADPGATPDSGSREAPATVRRAQSSRVIPAAAGTSPSSTARQPTDDRRSPAAP